MCCDGTLFDRVVLRAEEDAVFLGLDSPGKEKVSAFCAQPCPAHRGTSCKIYQDRPKSCRDFSCITRDALLDGAIDWEQAASRIAKARSLRAAAAAPDGQPHQDPMAGPMAGKAVAKVALERFLDRHFRPEGMKAVHAGPRE